MSKLTARFYHNFSFFLTCWLAVGRLSVTCRSTVGRQLTDSRPTGFLGSSSSQLPMPLAVLPPADLPGTKTILFQNVRSLHLHIEDVQSDYNIKKAALNIFVKTKLCLLDNDVTYKLTGFTLYRNDFSQSNIRTCYGTAVYIKDNLNCTEIPYKFNVNNVEITVTVLSRPVPNIHVVGIYRSETIRISQLIEALTHLHKSVLTKPTIPTILLGDFNINLMQESGEQKALKAYLITNRGYTQLTNQYTTDYRSQIDHIYTNIPQHVQSAGTLDSYYSDNKLIYISLQAVGIF